MNKLFPIWRFRIFSAEIRLVLIAFVMKQEKGVASLELVLEKKMKLERRFQNR